MNLGIEIDVLTRHFFIPTGRQADEKSTLDAIPTHFVRLLQLKGTEGAVAVLLRCVFGKSSPEV